MSYPKIIEDRIRERAYEIHEWRKDYECPYCEENNACSSCQLQDWLEAEQEVKESSEFNKLKDDFK